LRVGENALVCFTRAELEVLRWLRLGRSNRDIALILAKSEYTVKTQVQQMLAKTGLDNRVQLAMLTGDGAARDVQPNGGPDGPIAPTV
jgi:DNA-binding CsgD family transcriptional regulator